VLVKKYKVRVIMTTHSPSTVALAPEESLFEMQRVSPRIRRSQSKADTIGLLTAGLVTVSASTRFVLVEDDDDVLFYSAVRDILMDFGPSKDREKLRPSPTIVFLPASRGKGAGKTGGGSSVVTQWVEKFDAQPLSKLVRGIVDRDVSNSATARVYVGARFSIENYLLDPFVVLARLLDEGKPLTIAGIAVSRGDEHQIRALDRSQMKKVVDAVAHRIEPRLPITTALNLPPVLVSFTNGNVVEYPRWMIDFRGHDLLPIYQAEFGGPNVIAPPRLLSSFMRVRLLPAELAKIMQRLQE
jgi:hypothetical protein